MQNSEVVKVERTTPLAIPGAGAVLCAAIVVVLATFLPWVRVDFNALGSAFPGSAFPGAAGMGDALGGMMQQVTGQSTVIGRGIDGWVGVGVLLVGLVALAVTAVEASGAMAAARSNLLLVSFVAGLVACVLSLIAWTDLGGPVGIHIGLVLATLASAALAFLSFRRLQRLGQLSSLQRD